jgi:UDP-N-acetylmuramate--alanine ligase
MHITKNISSINQQHFAKAINGGVVYFIGIGGIGMSALAKYFLHKGATVSGYDKTPTAITNDLTSLGAQIHFEENVNVIPTNPDIVIYTPAIPTNHAELLHYQNLDVTILKRSQVLGLITYNAHNICVAGTHGKTTVSTMISHVLHHTGFGCNAFLGGISVNYNTNFLSSANDTCVIEADEYDRSFLQLQPSMAVITSMDADHLDIYGTEDAVHEGFIAFSKKIVNNGFLLAKFGLPKANQLEASIIWTYHLNNEQANVYTKNIKTHNGTYTFDVVVNQVLYENITLNVGGLHNIENSLAAITNALYLGIDIEKIKLALAAYKGVKRRFEYIIAPSNQSNFVMIDDYAHHPTELNALINGVHSLFPNYYKVIVFQPHLFTRTRDFASEFSASLSNVNEVVLLPIYPARELPIAGVESEMLLEKINCEKKNVLDKEAMIEHLKTTIADHKNPTVVIMAGAGDIDLLLEPVKNILINK